MASVLSLVGSRADSSSRIHAGLWRADQLDAHGVRTLSSGHDALDAELPDGGWPLHALTELLLARAGAGELRLLAPVLHTLTTDGRAIMLLGTPHHAYGPALQQLGISLEHLLVVDAEQTADRLWAAEQALKSASIGALLAWLPLARPEQLRRLQLAAQAGNGLTFLFRPLTAQTESSPAPLRIVCRAMRSADTDFEFRKLGVEIIKRRGPVLDAPLLLDLPQPVAPTRVVRPVPNPLSHAAPRRVASLPVIADALDRARLSVPAA